MASLAHLAARRRRPEIMDDPGLDGPSHLEALAGLTRLNRWSRAAHTMWRTVRPTIEAMTREGAKDIRVLDIATGAGDLPIFLAQRAQASQFPVSIVACDISPRALTYASERAKEAGVDIEFFVHDVVNQPLEQSYDILTCSLFLHHLDETEAITLLRHLKSACGRLLVIGDLVRSRTGYAVVYAASRLLTRSPVVHVDGPRSVEGAFRRDELEVLLDHAGLVGATSTMQWPVRTTIRWSPPT